MCGKSIIVDCDAGIDDALALIILVAAHKRKQIEIKGITCVNGNTTVDNVVRNVFRTLEVCEATEIPVFRGAHAPLLSIKNDSHAADEQYYGNDGFGDVYKNTVNISKLQSEHAVCALNRIVSKNPGKITLVCLGPLTNIALAVKMYSEFLNNVKDLYIMGGNSTAQGNVTAQAEFNFYADPESVHIVLNNNKKPLWLLPWETCLNSHISHVRRIVIKYFANFLKNPQGKKSSLSQEWRRDVFGQIDKRCICLMNDIENGRRLAGKKHFPTYIVCDAVLAGIVIRPEIANRIASHHADIELHGRRTRGQVVLDHLQSNEPNITLIESFDSEAFKDILLHSVDAYEASSDKASV